MAYLGALSLHFWRPDFTPEQASLLYRDYIDDLREFPLHDIRYAIQRYRQSGEKFFPTSGQLVQLVLGADDLERENPGASDRATTLHRIRGVKRRVAQKELLEMAAKIEQKLLT